MSNITNPNTKPKYEKIVNILFYFVIILLFLTIAGCFMYDFYTDYKELKKTVSNQEIIIKNNNKTISERNKNIEKLEDKISEYEKQVEFMDKYVAICPLDGKGTYHKYGCTHYDGSVDFYIHNIGNAENNGFNPCKYCEKDNTTKAEKGETVYVTDTGTKYHREWCSYLKSKNAIDKDLAIEEGYEPCSRCNP